MSLRGPSPTGRGHRSLILVGLAAEDKVEGPSQHPNDRRPPAKPPSPSGSPCMTARHRRTSRSVEIRVFPGVRTLSFVNGDLLGRGPFANRHPIRSKEGVTALRYVAPGRAVVDGGLPREHCIRAGTGAHPTDASNRPKPRWARPQGAVPNRFG